MFKVLVGCLVTLMVLHHGNGASYYIGSCPMIDPQQNFNMTRMLGFWYAIQETSSFATCLTYNFVQTEEPDEYQLEQTFQRFSLSPVSRIAKDEYHMKRHLTILDPSVPARMFANLSFGGPTNYTVFTTDYDTYAGFFRCQNLGALSLSRQVATILSREKTLDQMYVRKIRSKLSAANIDSSQLSTIGQKSCTKPDEDGININTDKTFSTLSRVGVNENSDENGVEHHNIDIVVQLVTEGPVGGA